MMKTLLAASALVAFASPALAVVNGGFETGDTTGWTASPNAGATSDFAGQFSPIEGDYFGYAQGGNGDDVYATLSQTFTLTAGSTISGYFGFFAGDYLPYDDDGYLSINGVNILAYSVSALGTYGNSGWVPFSFTAPTAGSYTLEIGGRNVLDNGGGPTGAVIDAVTVTSGAVPEASTWAMLIAGFGLVGAAARRRRTAAAA